LEGGCSIPVFALATLEKESLTLRGGIVSLDGQTRISLEVSGKEEQAEELGEKLAQLVFAEGGKQILEDIKKSQANK
jgi:hydroxymethylbilane synthase